MGHLVKGRACLSCRATLVFLWMVSVLTCHEQWLFSQENAGPLILEAGTQHGMYYSSFPDYQTSAVQYSGTMELAFGGSIGNPRLFLLGQLGTAILPPPAAGEGPYSVRGLLGTTAAIRFEYQLPDWKTSLWVAADVFRYWNTRVRMFSPELGLSSQWQLMSWQADGQAVELFIGPSLYIHLRKDSATALGAGISTSMQVHLPKGSDE